MKTALTCLLFCFFLGCAQNTKEVSILFKPEGKMTYNYNMTSDILNMTGTLDANFNQKKDSVEMDIEITSLSTKDRENKDLGSGEFIGNNYTRKYDSYGRPLDLDNLPKQVINADLFIVEFPKSPIKVGTSWKAKKTAKPDMFFDIINVEYTCNFIKDDVIIVKADMDFATNDKITSEMKLSRKYEGEYIVDIKTGNVIAAQLYMDMFSGFSKLTGKIEIIKQ